MICCWCSTADFLKELPVIVRKSEPLLDGVIDKAQPLERTLKLRELQTSYVYTTVLAKKCRVRELFWLEHISGISFVIAQSFEWCEQQCVVEAYPGSCVLS